MRIVGGQHKGKRLKVSKKGLRPTKSIVREAIFDILSKGINNADVLDIFAGSGALGLEALSRGAKSCVFIEKTPKTLIKNINNTSSNSKIKIQVIKDDFRMGLKRFRKTKFDIIFLDPPYYKNYINKAIKLLVRYNLLKENTVIVAEHHSDEELILPDGLLVLKKKYYGDTAITFIVQNQNADYVGSKISAVSALLL